MSVTYIHSRGIHQFYSAVLNNVFPVVGPQYQYESGGVFNQNQLIVNTNVRVGTRLTLFGFYVLSYANSNTSGVGSFASNPALGIGADYGRAGFDISNRVFLGRTVGLPHGFRISPLLVASSAAPFNVTIGRGVSRDAIFKDRAALASVDPRLAAPDCPHATH